MTKQQFKNLWHCYRKGLGIMTRTQVLAWIGHYNKYDRILLEKIVY